MTDFLDVQQGSEDWLEARRSHVTATDAAKIMGISPWGTAHDVYLDKRGEAPPFISNPGVEYGRKMEPVIREFYEARVGEWFPPAVAVNDFCLASLDGINSSNTKIIEIKTCNNKVFEGATYGRVPPYYLSQACAALFCVPSAECVEFIFYNSDRYAFVTIERDEEYIQSMIEELREFYENSIINGNPPALTEKDVVDMSEVSEWMDMTPKAKEVNSQIKALKKEMDFLRSQFIELSDDGTCEGGGVKLIKCWKSGSLDTDKMIADNIDIEKYRKSPTGYTILKID